MRKKIKILISVFSLYFLFWIFSPAQDTTSIVDKIESERIPNWEGIGTISLGFETSSFKPIDFQERWWVSFASDSIAKIYYKYAGEPKSSSPNDYIKFRKPVTFYVTGDVSKSGHFGHMGFYSRKITISKITEPPKALIK